jgi:hypothetical protein
MCRNVWDDENICGMELEKILSYIALYFVLRQCLSSGGEEQGPVSSNNPTGKTHEK